MQPDPRPFFLTAEEYAYANQNPESLIVIKMKSDDGRDMCYMRTWERPVNLMREWGNELLPRGFSSQQAVQVKTPWGFSQPNRKVTVVTLVEGAEPLRVAMMYVETLMRKPSPQNPILERRNVLCYAPAKAALAAAQNPEAAIDVRPFISREELRENVRRSPFMPDLAYVDELHRRWIAADDELRRKTKLGSDDLEKLARDAERLAHAVAAARQSLQLAESTASVGATDAEGGYLQAGAEVQQGLVDDQLKAARAKLKAREEAVTLVDDRIKELMSKQTATQSSALSEEAKVEELGRLAGDLANAVTERKRKDTDVKAQRGEVEKLEAKKMQTVAGNEAKRVKRDVSREHEALKRRSGVETARTKLQEAERQLSDAREKYKSKELEMAFLTGGAVGGAAVSRFANKATPLPAALAAASSTSSAASAAVNASASASAESPGCTLS